MLSRKLFWSITLTVAVAGIAGGVLIADGLLHREVTTTDAAWKDFYDNAGALARDVDAIVLATAVAVEPGRIAYSDNGEDALPFQVFEFDVVRGVKGASPGERLFVERAGGDGPDGHVFLDMDGGPFELGHTYMLFLKQQPDGPYFYQVNSQGRFRVANARLEAADPDDAVAAQLHRRTVSEGISIVRQHLRTDRTPETR